MGLGEEVEARTVRMGQYISAMGSQEGVGGRRVMNGRLVQVSINVGMTLELIRKGSVGR